MNKLLIFFALGLFLLSCSSDTENIESPEIRVANAINNFKSKLTAPEYGWKVNYQPTSESGIFLLLMKFNENGEVLIQSDVPDNNGEFRSQKTTYRIDNSLGLELIFENYSVLHYLFELDQSQFGAEFEFYYSEELGGNLMLFSKSDGSNPTIFVLEQAEENDDQLLSINEAENLSKFSGQSPIIFGGEPPVQQLYFPSKNISLFWGIDVVRRTIYADFAGIGSTLEEIESNNTISKIGAISAYGYSEGKLVLKNTITFNLYGLGFSFNEINLDAFSNNGDPLCNSNPVSTPIYTGSVFGIGDVIISKSLVNSTGFDFDPNSDFPYAVNSLFVFDSEAKSLYEEGSIAQNIPGATAFVFNYGFQSTTQPENAVGFYLDDDQGNREIYLRLFTINEAIGNKLTISLSDSVYSESPISDTDKSSIISITDEIFEGNTIYASDLPVDGIKVYRLFNPCNQYEFFLVK